MNTPIETNGLGTCQHDQTQNTPYWDGCAEIDLGTLDAHYHQIADARIAIHAILDQQMTANNIPHTPAIDRMIELMPEAELIPLLHRNRIFCCQDESEIQDSLEALESCSAALVAADNMFNRFLRLPSVTRTVDIHAVAVALEQALAALQTAYAK